MSLKCIFSGALPRTPLGRYTGGAYSAPPDLIAGGEGAGCALPKNPCPLSSFGLEFRPFGPQECPSQDKFLVIRLWMLAYANLAVGPSFQPLRQIRYKYNYAIIADLWPKVSFSIWRPPPSWILRDINFAGKTSCGTTFFGLCIKFGANPFKNGPVIAV